VKPQTARLDRSGRLVLPAAVRDDLELREGDEVVFVSSEGGHEVRMLPRHAAVRQAQAIVRRHLADGPSVVDALIAERRREAAAEDGEAQLGANPRRET